MANVEVTADINAKMTRLDVIIQRMNTINQQPGDFTEAVAIVEYLTQLLQARRDRWQTAAIIRLLRAWNRATGRM